MFRSVDLLQLLLAEDVANIMDGPDWDDSDASSDEDNEYSPLGLRDPLQ